MTSLNHYTSSITILCQTPNDGLICVSTPSSVTLADGGTATVQLTITNMANDGGIHPATTHSSWGTFSMLVSFLPLSLIFVRRRRIMAYVSVAAMTLSFSVSCGDGGARIATSSSGQSSVNRQPISIAVLAVAANTPSDHNNQKNLGPILITTD
jgi:hypothetical protein